MKKPSLKIFTGLFFSFSLIAAGITARSADGISAPQTKPLMQQFLSELVALKSYFVSEDKFLDPANNDQIEKHLKEFARLSREAQHNPQLNQENFKFSRYVLEEHITDTERIFRLGNKSYARWKLASTISVCMSCHTQMPTAEQKFKQFDDPKDFASDFDQAEFLFAIRSFSKAIDIYDRVISGFPENKVATTKVERALERELTYYSRVLRDPTAGIAKMQSHLKDKDLPEYLKNNMNMWILQMQAWKKQKSVDPAKIGEKELLAFARKNLENPVKGNIEATNPNLVTYLRVSGVLYEFLQDHPQARRVPEILYWLSICDRAISNNFFYSLADLYLRECITRFPADPVAKKCLKEYEDETILGYTGSAGTHLPPEVKRDLEDLKKLVESGGKVELKVH